MTQPAFRDCDRGFKPAIWGGAFSALHVCVCCVLALPFLLCARSSAFVLGFNAALQPPKHTMCEGVAYFLKSG